MNNNQLSFSTLIKLLNANIQLQNQIYKDYNWPECLQLNPLE